VSSTPGAATPEMGRPSPANLGEYYRSIEPLFHETRRLQEREKKGESLTILLVLLFVMSLFPAIPYACWRLVPQLITNKVIEVRGLHLPLASFWLWWTICFAISLLLLVIRFSLGGPSKTERTRRLSSSQMRFAYAYGAAKEIRDYLTNRLSPHLDTASNYIDALASALTPLTFPDIEIAYAAGLRPSEVQFVAQRSAISVTGLRRPGWYKLDPVTEQILQALRELQPKTKDRLRDKKDLTVIQSAMTELSGYLYTEVPEISDGTEEQVRPLKQYGLDALLRFATTVNGLAAYASEPVRPTPQEDVSRKVAQTGQKLTGLFLHENVLIGFVAWYVLTLFLVSLAIYLGCRFAGVRFDSVVLSTLVGVPVAGAITAVTIPRLRRERPKNNTDE
jgi:hypothetical protein